MIATPSVSTRSGLESVAGDPFQVSVTGTRTLFGENKKPFSVFEVEVKSVNGKSQVLKTLRDFVVLNQDLCRQGIPVPPVPKERAHGKHSNFLKDTQACLQAWLKLLSAEPLVASSEILKTFVTTSAQGLDIDKVYPLVDKTEDEKKAPLSEDGIAEIEGKDSYNMEISDSPSGRKRSKERSGKSVSLEDFSLLKVIGKGSFGKVMLVRKLDTKKVYAMKVLHKANVIKRNQVEHTRTERNVLEYIRHPFIVTLRYAFQTKLKLYFVLDYCPGGELFFHLGRAGRFPESRARFYAAQITLALQYLHDLGIVYRDLKPENVLLDGDGNIALTDFGLSKEGINDNVSAHSFCGTPEYLAPEILTRAGHGRAADWWSLGALLYEMLTGMPPFYSRNRERLFQKILKSSLHLHRYFSPQSKSILQGLLNRNPVERLGSRDDAAAVKSHPFFKDMDWELLYQKRLRPPFRPQVGQLADTANFDPEFTTMQISVDHTNRISARSFVGSVTGAAGKFPGFTYVGDENSLDERVGSIKLNPV
mmetsp:Transcript_20516/g.28667  ORF Transcript_20516/g.28667 Transcript_20516/m.28667 type:complete len:534 (-) Transcript_20516:362-1963(-)|eukprot:CAMPEP_0184487320 /NCGR_PEP_ID=MMETSP0113_2-20130426/9753_1 /TAXON_ID=91329 /ORGANISM="Norrisiella sphaerica, Strain BC52" /LENGTH=533 /DNA_ID=CAMNT_0026869577 /DNA_START=317 /DNA_END=1918 /DNA_ORIENTATION=+